MATQLSFDPDDDESVGVDCLDLDRRLRRCAVAVAERELRTALGSLDELTPAQRRIVARMAGRIAAGVLAPARDVAEDGDSGTDTADERAVARLFDPERIRDRR